MIILDFGSGETCQNDKRIVERMIDELDAIDSRKHDVVIKWQLFTEVPAKVTPLAREVYEHAVAYGKAKGYPVTASVFDEEWCDYLVEQKPRFIKIAARPNLYSLISRIPVEQPVVVSVADSQAHRVIRTRRTNIDLLCCVPEYPAGPLEYERRFGNLIFYGISDHTTDLFLYNGYRPAIWERHYCLESSTGPDAGPFAIRPAELAEVLG
jgi:sialic acid synthase SpsE